MHPFYVASKITRYPVVPDILIILYDACKIVEYSLHHNRSMISIKAEQNEEIKQMNYRNCD